MVWKPDVKGQHMTGGISPLGAAENRYRPHIHTSVHKSCDYVMQYSDHVTCP